MSIIPVNTNNYMSIMHNSINNYMCPISLQIFKNPVIIEDGFTYEYDEIKKWFENNNRSPLTNNILQTKIIFMNHTMKQSVEDYLKLHPELIQNQYSSDTIVSNVYEQEVVEQEFCICGIEKKNLCFKIYLTFIAILCVTIMTLLWI